MILASELIAQEVLVGEIDVMREPQITYEEYLIILIEWSHQLIMMEQHAQALKSFFYKRLKSR